MQNAVDRLDASVTRFDALRGEFVKGNIALTATQLAELNKLMYQSERAFLNPDGLPRRPWFRHSIYAPGFYTGYGVKTLPGVREGIEEEGYEEAQEQVHVAAAAIERLAETVDAASGLLRGNKTGGDNS